MITGTLTYECDECGTPQAIELDGGRNDLVLAGTSIYMLLDGPNWPDGWVRVDDETLELCPLCYVAWRRRQDTISALDTPGGPAPRRSRRSCG